MRHKSQQTSSGSSSETLREREADIARKKADERRKTDYTVDPYRYNN